MDASPSGHSGPMTSAVPPRQPSSVRQSVHHLTGKASGRGRVSNERHRLHLNCPRCRLTITPKATWLTIAHCPRCVARCGVLISLFASILTAEELYATDMGDLARATTTARSKSTPRRQSVPTSRTAPVSPLPTHGTRSPSERPELTVGDARQIAECAHRGQHSADGRPYIDHVERVAKMVPSDARAVAWLHDVVEQSNLDQVTLVRAGASADQLRALSLITRDKTEQTDQTYLEHLSAIIDASGRSGHIARSVKRADLRDHLRHPAPHSTGWRPPFLEALALMGSDVHPSSRVRPRTETLSAQRPFPTH
jgi:hypothetical protein